MVKQLIDKGLTRRSRYCATEAVFECLVGDALQIREEHYVCELESTQPQGVALDTTVGVVVRWLDLASVDVLVQDSECHRTMVSELEDVAVCFCEVPVNRRGKIV